MGQVRKRGKTYWIRYYDRNGKRQEESAKTTSKSNALALLRIREGDLAKGLPVTSQTGRLKFDEAVERVITDYRVNHKRSLGDVQIKVRRHLIPWFGGRRMATMSTAEILQYVNHRQAPADGSRGAANAQINRELAILKRAFRLAMRDGKLLHMPHVPMLAEKNVRSGFFETEAFEEVRSHLPPSLQAVVTLAFFTGWRVRSEILPLTWAQVDRQTQVIRLDPGTTKNGDGRTLPYRELPELVQIIEEQWASHAALRQTGRIVPYLFHRKGKPIRNFYKTWQSACVAAGVPGKLLHDFRRTAVRNLVRAGVPEKTAQMVTGHKTRSVFDRYDIVNELDLQHALGRLAGTGTKRGQFAENVRSASVSRFV